MRQLFKKSIAFKQVKERLVNLKWKQ
jgi:hypothetical protein